MFMVEFFDYGLNRLSVVVVEFLIGIEKFGKSLARFNELNAELAAFFPVLLVFGLFVVRFGKFDRVIYRVNIVEILFRNFFGFRALALCGEFLHKLEVGQIYSG